MNHSEKCVSLETAQRLKEAGFPQETERWWVMKYPGSLVLPGPRWVVLPICEFVFWKDDEYLALSAPDAQEIGELLPFRNKRMGTVNDAILLMCKFGRQWSVGYVDEDGAEGPFKFLEFNGATIRFINENLAEAMAACYIYLKEQGLI